MCHTVTTQDFEQLTEPTQAPVKVFGRVVKGFATGEKMTSNDTYLESEDGIRIKLDLSFIKSYDLFSGQVCFDLNQYFCGL